tara:strand:+ start:1591 stop:2118 length:528 start_codon:yes stop_codon:yes gene_type:complete
MYLYYLKKLNYLNRIFYITTIFVISACNDINFDKIDKDFSELVDWSFNDDTFQVNKDLVPISSKTLNSFIIMDQEYMKFDFLLNDKNNIIEAFVFIDVNYELHKYHSNLMLIARAQKFEKFKINIVSNKNANKSSFLLDKIQEMLMLEGVSRENINKEYEEHNDKFLIIKLVKAN